MSAGFGWKVKASNLQQTEKAALWYDDRGKHTILTMTVAFKWEDSAKKSRNRIWCRDYDYVAAGISRMKHFEDGNDC